MPKLPPAFDYLFMDSDHSAPFASWYVQHLFPRVKDGGLVSVHDVFHKSQPGFPPEGYEKACAEVPWFYNGFSNKNTNLSRFHQLETGLHITKSWR